MVMRRQEPFNLWIWLRQAVFQLGSFFLGLLLCFVLVNRVPWNALFPIREVDISGAVLTDHQLIKEEILPLIKEGFFNVKPAQVKERLLAAMPWVDDAYIRLGWPNTLIVTIYEKKPSAIWNQNTLLDAQGNIFTIPNLNYPGIKTLPLLEGDSSRQSMVFYIYKQIQPVLLSISPIAKISLRDDLYWEIQLQNGLILFLGMQDMMPALSRFKLAYPQVISAHINAIEYIDLRYSNGISIRWRSTLNKSSHSSK